MRILITDSNVRAALAMVRSLGRRGETVIVAGESPRSLCAVSRYVSGFELVPSPAKQPEAFVTTVAEVAARAQIDVILPVAELSTLLLVEHRALLPERCVLPFASHEAIGQAADKVGLMRIANQCGVPVPESVELAYLPKSIAELPSGLRYPVVIKPGRSRVKAAAGWIGAKVSYAADRSSLWAGLTSLDPAQYPVLLQERIEGPGIGYFACYEHGKLVASFAHRRLREKPPSGGVSVLRESVPVNPQALEYGSRLLEGMAWHGVAMVEFKEDSRDGSLRLMEINPRFWGSLQLAIDAGVDFPAILADIAVGRRVEASSGYHVGVRSRWLLGDLDALLTVLLRQRKSLNLPDGFPSRARVLWDFLHLWRKRERYEVLRWDDPRPGLAEIRQWVRGGLRGE